MFGGILPYPTPHSFVVFNTCNCMKLKHIIVSTFAAFAFNLSICAQTAQSVLNQTSSTLRSAGGIEATFEGTQFKGSKETGTATGSIQISGNKFKLSSSSLTSWFDGRTQWTLLAGSDEVNVSNPTAAELQQINPYTFLNLYKKGYTLTMRDVSYHGATCHEVRMVAQGRQSNIQQLIAVIDKQTHYPLSIRIKNSKGDWSRIRVSNIRAHQKWADSNFRFDAKQHPGIEVIDLR